MVQPCNTDGELMQLLENETNNHNTFLVNSQAAEGESNHERKYFVSFNNKHPTCNCFDWTWTGQKCKHIVACITFKKRGSTISNSFIDFELQVIHLQDW